MDIIDIMENEESLNIDKLVDRLRARNKIAEDSYIEMGANNMFLNNKELTYKQRCAVQKKDLGIPDYFDYDIDTKMVTMPYDAYKNLKDRPKENKFSLTKENMILIKILIKIYLRGIFVFKSLSVIACIGFLINEWPLFSIISVIVFCLVFMLPNDEEDLKTLFLEKLKKL